MTSDSTKQMASDVFEKFFRFNIGDIVVPKATLAMFRAELEVNGKLESKHYGESHRVNLGVGEVVVERMLQQCHGGIQGFYMLRRHDAKGIAVFDRVADCEVESFAQLIEAAKTFAADHEPKK